MLFSELPMTTTGAEHESTLMRPRQSRSRLVESKETPMTNSPERKVASDVDYGRHGQGYASLRRTDPRIAARVHQALGDAPRILTVGAGAGSYEPQDTVTSWPSSLRKRYARNAPAIWSRLSTASPGSCRWTINRSVCRWRS